VGIARAGIGSIALAMILAGCSGSDESAAPAPPPMATTVSEATWTAATTSGQFRDIDELRPAGPVGFVTIGDAQQRVTFGPSLTAMLARGLDLCA
jgi:hypothetical protein